MDFQHFILLGAGSDVACRYVFPALAELEAANQLPQEFVILGITRKVWQDDGTFRRHIEARVKECGSTANLSALPKLLTRVNQASVDLSDIRRFKNAIGTIRDPVVLYLGLPPAISEGIVGRLGELGLSAESRIMIEKPFGHNLQSAQDLNRGLHKMFPEDHIFRVDHFLAKQTVQNILGIRFANRVLESVWDHQHVERVEIVWEETNALEGRIGYYDAAGALKDMIQNHLLQLMCLLALEPPSELTEPELHDRKMELLKAVRPFSEEQIAAHTARGRYTAGQTGGRAVKGYLDEPGVDPHRGTETFAEVRFFIDNPRWRKVPFVLRTGKALKEDRQEISIFFKPPRHSTFISTQVVRSNELRLGLKPDQVGLVVNVNGPGNPLEAEPVELHTDLAPEPMTPYASLIRDVLIGNSMFFIRDDEAEEAWKVIDPITAAWKKDVVPLQSYPAGSIGLPSLE
ncbi:MAG: glucose-6-phosphate dehydrogenase [Nitrospira sp.]